MASEIVIEFIGGPFTLVLNLLEHGVPPSSIQGLKEFIVSAFGTAAWGAVLGFGT